MEGARNGYGGEGNEIPGGEDVGFTIGLDDVGADYHSDAEGDENGEIAEGAVLQLEGRSGVLDGEEPGEEDEPKKLPTDDPREVEADGEAEDGEDDDDVENLLPSAVAAEDSVIAAATAGLIEAGLDVGEVVNKVADGLGGDAANEDEEKVEPVDTEPWELELRDGGAEKDGHKRGGEGVGPARLPVLHVFFYRLRGWTDSKAAFA